MQPAWTDIILLQEDKLTCERAANLGRKLNQSATYIFSEATHGYGNGDRGSGIGCGATAMLLRSNLERFVINLGSLFQGRAIRRKMGSK